ALHRSAEREWHGLKAAVDAARQQGLRIQLKVMVSEEALKDQISAEPDDVIETVPSLSTELTRSINDFAPQILHFFCHGSYRDGIRRLELATVVDWDQAPGQEAQSSLRLAISELAEATKGIWLVVLNACEGGSGSQEAYSFAHELVKAGLPAAIGMRRAIDAIDANTFSAAFYPSLFSLLRSMAGLAQGEAALEWGDLLVGARRALRDRHGDPSDDDTWTLPVLYVHPTTFQLVTNAAAAVRDVERNLGSTDIYQALAQVLNSANAPSSVIDELLAQAANTAAAATS
ncbi:MAG: CHAT domain-containing protein, partial [bacterium]